MKKKKFNVSLFSTSVEVVNSLIIGAAAHNGGIAETTLQNLKTMGEGLQRQFKSKIDTTFELVGENQLCIDAKIKGNWQPIAVIEMVEVFEIPKGKNDDDDMRVDILSASKYRLE